VTAAVLSARGISKSFGHVRVLDNVDFEVLQGEIHALVGGNGAGKSTLMKILIGAYSADEGTYEVQGREVSFDSVQAARQAGVGMVFQEFSLVPTLTVAQNVFLAREPRNRAGLLDDRQSERRTRELFRILDVEVDPRRRLDELPTSYWQLTEIAKALSQDARILIMDEPTAALAKTETDQLFALMRRLKEQGISIVYISHRMEEVFEVGDRVTILRDGRKVLTEASKALTISQVIDHIVGRKLEQAMAWKARETPPETDSLLEIRNLRSGKLQGLDLEVRHGEIVGLAGLMGSGRSELARAIFGIDPIDSGEVVLRGRPVDVRGPRDAIDVGIALIPEDRRAQGLVLDHTLKQNFLLPLLKRLLIGLGFLDDRKGDRLARSFVERLAIRTPSIDHPVQLLSGGNQQKVVIAKWLATEPQLLLMDEPTAGVDIGTKGEIVTMIRDFADAGNSVIIISSELPELLAVSDRVVIMRDGRVERTLPRVEIRSEEDLHHAVQGVG
jgi:ribose transport system ATP-binding protein